MSFPIPHALVEHPQTRKKKRCLKLRSSAHHEEHALTAHQSAAQPRSAFSPDSLHLMAAAANGTVHIFRSPKEVAARGALGARISGDDETKVGLLVGGFFFPKSAENDGRQGLIKMLVGGMKVT